MYEDFIFVFPKECVFFENQEKPIPKAGAFITPSSYYFKLVREKRLEIAPSKFQIVQKE